MRILQKLLRLAGVELTLQKGRPSADKSVFKQLRDRLKERIEHNLRTSSALWFLTQPDAATR
jgi:hypothetical protein